MSNDPRHYLPFADPRFAPEWLSRTDPDRPPWGGTDEARFASYCRSQIAELDRRAQAHVAPSRAHRATLDQLYDAGRAERFYKSIFLEQIEMSHAEFERQARRVAEAAETERKRSGPTRANPHDREDGAPARAALDMAKLRFVIYPRCWGKRQLKRPSVEHIVAPLHHCEPSAAASWYENERVAKHWKLAERQVVKDI